MFQAGSRGPVPVIMQVADPAGDAPGQGPARPARVRTAVRAADKIRRQLDLPDPVMMLLAAGPEMRGRFGSAARGEKKRHDLTARVLLPIKRSAGHGAGPPMATGLHPSMVIARAPRRDDRAQPQYGGRGDSGILAGQRPAAQVVPSAVAMQAASTAAHSGPRRTWYSRVLLGPPSRGRSVSRPAARSRSITGRTRLSLTTRSLAILRVVTRASSGPETRSMAVTTSAKNRLPKIAAERFREAAYSSACTCVV